MKEKGEERKKKERIKGDRKNESKRNRKTGKLFKKWKWNGIDKKTKENKMKGEKLERRKNKRIEKMRRK